MVNASTEKCGVHISLLSCTNYFQWNIISIIFSFINSFRRIEFINTEPNVHTHKAIMQYLIWKWMWICSLTAFNRILWIQSKGEFVEMNSLSIVFSIGRHSLILFILLCQAMRNKTLCTDYVYTNCFHFGSLSLICI